MRKKGFIPLFLLGGCGYVLLEKVWRGYSHWTMFFLGGGCFHLIGAVDTHWRRKPWWQRGLLCAALVTAAEFACGCVVNLLCRMKVWDYRRHRFHLLGQVCLLYSCLWGLLSLAVMPLYRVCAIYYKRRRHTS